MVRVHLFRPSGSISTKAVSTNGRGNSFSFTIGQGLMTVPNLSRPSGSVSTKAVSANGRGNSFHFTVGQGLMVSLRFTFL